MSNEEIDPQETICEAAPGAKTQVQLLEPREVPLGGLRAMGVRRTLPQRARSLIGPWCFLDHYGPDDVAVTGGMSIAAHPHTGLQTVSWLFSGQIEHRDSSGAHSFVDPGEVNLMTAGSGISHSERSTTNTTVLHGVQLWIALPNHARHVERRFEHYAPPVVRGDRWEARVLIGSLLGSTSPVQVHSPAVGAEIMMDPGAVLEIETRGDFEYGVLLDHGSLVLHPSAAGGSDASADAGAAGVDVPLAHLAAVDPGVTALTLVAGPEGARVMLIGGEPFGERIIMWWNFVGRTHEEIIAARAEWQRRIALEGVGDVGPRLDREAAPVETDVPGTGQRGAEGEGGEPGAPSKHDQFGIPDGEPESPLPAPAAPIARLRPRE